MARSPMLEPVSTTLALKTPVSNMESLREVNTRLVGGFFFVIFVSLIFATVTERAYKVFEMVLGYVLIYWALTRQIGDYDRV